jgi:hypothetical protein
MEERDKNYNVSNSGNKYINGMRYELDDRCHVNK